MRFLYLLAGTARADVVAVVFVVFAVFAVETRGPQ